MPACIHSHGVRSYLEYQNDADKLVKYDQLSEKTYEVLHTDIKPIIEQFRLKKGLDEAFVRSVMKDLYFAAMDWLSWRREENTFFLQLLLFYQAGHFPCGWKGKQPPSGELMVF